MTVPPRRRTAPLAGATLGATLLLVAVGGFTRGSGSGYGCEDRWPLCENGALGGLLPRAEWHMVVEWTHRWLAAVVGVLVIATALVAWWEHRGERRVVVPAVGAVGLLGVEGYLGRLVVKGDLDADLVSLHLATAMVVVALLAATMVHTLPVPGRAAPAHASTRHEPESAWWPLLALGALVTFAVLVLGSAVHNEYVGGWPLVDGRVIPSFSGRVVTVHFAHRVASAVGLVLVAALARIAARRDRPRAEIALVYGALACYVGNVALGAAHVVTLVKSSGIVVAHLALATLAWTALVTGALLARAREEASGCGTAGPGAEPEPVASSSQTSHVPGM